jgi:hypothetical protein
MRWELDYVGGLALVIKVVNIWVPNNWGIV